MEWSVAEWNEIDVEIVPSLGEYAFNTNIIYAGQSFDGEGVRFNPGDEWHEYEFVWKPDEIIWYLDGTEVRRRSDTFSVRD